MPMDRPPVAHGWRMKLRIERIRDDKRYPNEHLIIVSAMEAQNLDLSRLAEAIVPPSTARRAADVLRDTAEVRARDDEVRHYVERHAERRTRYEEALRDGAEANRDRREAFRKHKDRIKRQKDPSIPKRKLKGEAKADVEELLGRAAGGGGGSAFT